MERIPEITDVLALGDTVKVKIIGIDGNDRIKLSRRVLLEEEARARGEEIPPRQGPSDRDRRDRGRRSDRDRGRRSDRDRGRRSDRGDRGRPPRRDRGSDDS